MKIKVCLALTLLFFIGMTVLTFTARDIHNSRLPHVTAKRLTRELFGDGFTRKLALPKELTEGDGVFIITSRIINGEKRDIARRVVLTTGQEDEEFYEVTGGIMGNELVIIESDRGLRDGDEVFVVK